jgi:hypothetical protein
MYFFLAHLWIRGKVAELYSFLLVQVLASTMHHSYSILCLVLVQMLYIVCETPLGLTNNMLAGILAGNLINAQDSRVISSPVSRSLLDGGLTDTDIGITSHFRFDKRYC